MRESQQRSRFRIEKTTLNSDIGRVLRFLLNLCHRPSLRFGLRRDPRGRFREPRFVSFMTQTNRRALDTDLHDVVLRGRKMARNLFRLGLAGGCAWIVLESARALSVF